ncbi:MAG: ABC transporter permease [Christensenellaceae bacterium]|jgi:simple sugar transport system permease protein|nr:ABC transporter permease [Christensenellaceae bacterium]
MNNVAKYSFKKRVNALFSDGYIASLVVLAITILVIMGIVKPRFVTVNNFFSMANQFPEYGIMSFGLMLTMMSGGIDLSVVSVANLAAICSAKVLLEIVPHDADISGALGGILVIMLIAMAIGALCGVLNGFLVSKIGIPPMLGTLGSSQLFTGICIAITQGKMVNGLPMAYSDFMTFRVFGVLPVVLIIFILCVLVLSFLLTWTTFGSKLRMLGSNSKAAMFSGLKVDRVLIATHMLASIFASIAGLVMLSNYNSAKADYGTSYSLLCILIVVLGGVRPSGGFGKVSGVVLAIVILQMVSSSLNMFPTISAFYRPLVWGAVLLVVMILDYYSDQRKNKISAKGAVKSER